MRRFYCLILVSIISVLFCVFSTPFLYNKFNDDYTRLATIHSWSTDPKIKPNFVIFGGSCAMNGINGYMIADAFDCKVASYTSTGQSFSESTCFYSRLPESVNVVIQGIIAYGEEWSIGVRDAKVDKLMLNGYQPDSLSLSLLDTQTKELFERSKIEVYYHSRNYLKNGIHWIIRSILEPHENAPSADTSLVYPYLFQYERADEAVWKTYAGEYRAVDSDTLHITPEFVEKIKMASDYFKKKNINYYLVLTPVSDYMEKGVPKNYTESLRKLENVAGVKVIDFTHLLEDDYFADPSHVNHSGAAILTSKLCEIIKEDLKD